ncbi:MAG: hypothetical protein HY278_11450 [candidate division NC10 bacterium]|nr:hypothetical protein [candidate division NC10 bacterium]
MIAGPPIKKGMALPRTAIEDVVPTLLYLLGLPIPTDLDGRVLAEAIEEEGRAAVPLVQASYWREEVSCPKPYSVQQEAVLGKRLRDLGYL